jgi:hypothetical protein
MALVGNISGSTQNSSNIGISGSVVIANRPDSLFPALGTLGTDVVFFVSGSRGGKDSASERTVSVFGGDAVVSGSLTVGTGSVTITSNDITFAGGITQILSGAGGLTFKDSSGTVTLSDIIAGAVIQPTYWQSNTAGEIFTTGSAVTSGSITVKDGSGNPVFGVNSASGNVSGSGNFSVGGNITIAGNVDTDVAEPKTLFASVGSNNITVGGGSSTVVIPGNLTVQGTTTTVETTNLVVKDPLIYMASASAAGTVAYGGIAIASGSGVTDQALVFVKDGTGTNTFWSSGRQDVVSGTITDSTGLIYLPVRASKFELGGTVGGANNAFLTSSDGASVVLSGSGVVTIGSNALQAVDIQFGGSQFATIAPVGANVKLGASAGKKLTLSGSQVVVQAEPGPTNAGFLMTTDTTSFLSIVSGTAPNSIAIRGEQAGNRLDLFNTNSTTVNFAGAATSITMGAASPTAATTTIRGGTLVGDTATQNIFNTVATTANLVGNAATLNLANAVTAGQTLNIATGVTTTGNTKAINIGTGGASGSTTNITLGSATAGALGSITANENLVPGGDVTLDLGSPSARWRNIYTGDLHLRNDRGDYTLIEEEDFLSIRFNKTGKRYKFVLEPVPELDEK